jgi:trimethylamine--corrinoid protein Co-methyltransferase
MVMFMGFKVFRRKIKPIDILTEEELEAIHLGSLTVLENVGVVFHHEKALKLLEQSGCEVDWKKKCVKIPTSVVEEALRKCPSSFVIKSRDPKSNVTVGGNILCFSEAPGMDAVEIGSWERIVPELQDQVNAVKLIDALDGIHLFSYGPYHRFKDTPPVMTHILQMACMVKYSTKIPHSGSHKGVDVWNIKIAKAAGTQLRGGVMASSPLTYYKDAIDAAFNFAEAGFPISLNASVEFGGTGPITLAGSMVVVNAELLAGIVLVQLIKPGLGVIVINFSHPMDMRTGCIIFGAVESFLSNMIFNQIWRKLGIPRMNVIYSSSKAIDYQSGYEKAMHALLSALSGANIISFHGGLYGELTWSPILAVLDDDIAHMIGRILEGVEVTDETLLIDLIEKVGPIPGHFLGTEVTRTMWKKLLFIPKAADRLCYSEWLKKGKKSALEYAKERVKEILATYEPIPLPEDSCKEIESIIKDAEKYYRDKGEF